MPDQKQPETEVEYWEAIESLGGVIFQMSHDLRRGRIDDPDDSILKSIINTQKIQHELAEELSKKFGVILPADCPEAVSGEESPPAPEGKIYYWDWYHKLAAESSLVEYQKLLCSACPFSAGFDDFMPNWRVTCKFDNVQPLDYRSHHIHLCFKVNRSAGNYSQPLTLEDIYTRILAEHGQEVLDAFKIKEGEVRSKFK